MTEKTEPSKPQMQLVIQAGIPVTCSVEAEAEYANLKIFLQSISPNVTLSGQIYKPLEPCCKKQEKGQANEKAAENAQ